MSRGLEPIENEANLFDPPRMLERVQLDKESSLSFLIEGAKARAASVLRTERSGMCLMDKNLLARRTHSSVSIRFKRLLETIWARKTNKGDLHLCRSSTRDSAT
jgi:hypothetical protein